MKNLVKYTALAAAIFGMATVAKAQAPQNQKTTTLNATANVGSDISVAGTDFTFGSVYRNNGPYTIAPTSAAAGFFLIKGTGASTVVATLSGDANLVSPSTSGTLPVIFSYALKNSGTGACTAGGLFGVPTSSSASANVTLDGAAGAPGEAKVCVGGKVTPTALTTLIATDYSGVVTITVDFP